MSVFSHFVEILRQGVWASLTGGWYYDPKRSTFCNTAHMYIWLILFIFPLTLRFYFEINIISIATYCALIGLFFAVIKSTNFYLHSIFDTHELIEQEIEAKISDVFKDDKSKDKPLELEEFCFNRGESDKSIEETNLHKEHANQCASSSSSNSQELASRPLLKHESANLRVINVDLHERPQGSIKSSPNSCVEIHDEKLQATKSDSKIIDESPSSKKIRLDLDGVELHGNRRAEDLSEDIILQESLSDEVFDRKYSEQVVFGFPENSFEGTTHRRKSNSLSKDGVRRTKSTMETSGRTKTHSSSATLLSNTALQECRGKGVRKSYPGKTSSTDIFLMNTRRSNWRDSTEKDGQMVFSNTNTSQEGTSLVEPSTPGSSVYMEGNEALPTTDNIDERAYKSVAHLSSITNKVTRFLSIDLPLTDIPERESESEKIEEPGLASMENTLNEALMKTKSVDSCETIKSKNQKSHNFRGARRNVMETTFSENDPSTSKSGRFYLSSDNKDLRNVSQNFDDTTDEQQKNLFQNLRKTLDNLKRTYEIPDSESFSVLRESSTPNLKWLFDEAAVNDLKTSTPFTSVNQPEKSNNPVEARQLLIDEMKRLLVEMIESHPEALQAIESVRQAKMASNSNTLLKDNSIDIESQKENKASSEESHCESDDYVVIDYSQPGPSSRFTGQKQRRRPRSPKPVECAIVQQEKHLATSFDDTSDGAVHCYQDSDGQWYTYTFSSSRAEEPRIVKEKSVERTRKARRNVGDHKSRRVNLSADRSIRRRVRRSSSSENDDQTYFDTPRFVMHPGIHNMRSLDFATRLRQSSVTGGPERSPTSTAHRSSGPTMPFTGSGFSSVSLINASNNRTRYRPQFNFSSLIGRRFRDGGAQHSTTLPDTSRAMRAAPESTSTVTLFPGTSSSMPNSSSVRVVNVENGPARNDATVNLLRMLAAGGAVSWHTIQDSMMRKRPSSSTQQKPRKKQYYCVKWPNFWPSCCYFLPTIEKSFKIRFDRLRLLALLDQNTTKFSLVFDTLLGVLVALVTCLLLKSELYYDIFVLLLCVMASSAHFSLLKSVQPDTASPVHGFNWLIPYSRPIYYSLIGLSFILFEYLAKILDLKTDSAKTYDLYILKVNLALELDNFFDFYTLFIIFLPIIFALGLLPQLNTFAIHTMEQIDMTLFGGTASFGLFSGIYNISRSIFLLLLNTVFCYLSLQNFGGAHTIPYSAFASFLITTSFWLSRTTSDHRIAGHLIGRFFSTACQWSSGTAQSTKNDDDDYERNCNLYIIPTVSDEIRLSLRFKNDFFAGVLLAIAVFALHCTTLFTNLSQEIFHIFPVILTVLGLFSHFLLPNLRRHKPFLLLAKPFWKNSSSPSDERDHLSKISWYERLYAYLCCFEANFLYMIFIFACISLSIETLLDEFGNLTSAIIVCICAMKLFRSVYCNISEAYIPLILAYLFYLFDLNSNPDDFSAKSTRIFVIDYYIFAALYPKIKEFALKYQFIFLYVAPWQISWGSAFHAFAQPCAVAHSALTLVLTAVSSLISAPLNPFLGSAVFLMSYVRPVKFWEKDYNTKRLDHSNTRLASQIDRAPAAADDNNLNAIFYEHLTRSLQTSLAGDLALGRLACSVSAGDCFVMASFYLNCLVHIIEVGNGFVTFQLRGLELRGTYCQQREVEAINEEQGDTDGCCCYYPGHLPGFLSLNTAWNLRWLAWEVTTANYVLDGYSVTDNSAVDLLQIIDLRKLLVTLYVKCMIYYAVRSPKIDQWLNNGTVLNGLSPILFDEKYSDADESCFSARYDEDYDHLSPKAAISLKSFSQTYTDWVKYCVRRRLGGDGTETDSPTAAAASSSTERRQHTLSYAKDSPTIAFCYALSLVGRRALSAASHGRHSSGAESFLYGLHALFKGDFRITYQRDEWVFADIDILRCVVAPAVRMALKLHQDHFVASDDDENPFYLYQTISTYEKSLFISHESDPAWRKALLANTPSLLALRHVFEDGQDDFKIIMLNKRYVNFRLIKLNKECVRAFWAGQQQEQIFLRNRNPERGSIQNARQVLRNIINSSADQPIGYPIYVSPLTTSFIESHPQIRSLMGPFLNMDDILTSVRRFFRRLVDNCGISSSGSANLVNNPLQIFGQNQIQATANFIEFTSTLGVGSSASDPSQMASSKKQTAVADASKLSPSLPIIMQRSNTIPVGQMVNRNDTRRSLGNNDSRNTFRRRQKTFQCRCPAETVDVISNRRRPSDTVVVYSASGDKRSRVSLSCDSILRDRLENSLSSKVLIKDSKCIISNLDLLDYRFDWPNEDWKLLSTRCGWRSWSPKVGLEGEIVHKWPKKAIPGEKTILLLRVLNGRYYVPVDESGVEYLSDNSPKLS